MEAERIDDDMPLNRRSIPGGQENSRERRDAKKRARAWRKPAPLSPTRMALILAGAVFALEFLIMFLLRALPPLSDAGEAMLDSSILIGLLIPVYLFFYRPFWDEHQSFSGEVSQLSRKLMRTVEEERKRVSHELHDQCGQTLTALQFGLEALRNSMPETSAESKTQVRDLTLLVAQLSNEMREVTYSLRPEMLEQIGLIPGLRSLVADFSANHPEVEISESYPSEEEIRQGLNDEVDLALYRICQECLHNISKHSRAREVVIRLERRISSVVLNMGDHGIGFDPRARNKLGSRQRTGIGFLGIRERVADLGGTFRLSTEVGKGTFITVELPVISEAGNGKIDQGGDRR